MYPVFLTQINLCYSKRLSSSSSSSGQYTLIIIAEGVQCTIMAP